MSDCQYPFNLVHKSAGATYRKSAFFKEYSPFMKMKILEDRLSSGTYLPIHEKSWKPKLEGESWKKNEKKVNSHKIDVVEAKPNDTKEIQRACFSSYSLANLINKHFPKAQFLTVSPSSIYIENLQVEDTFKFSLTLLNTGDSSRYFRIITPYTSNFHIRWKGGYYLPKGIGRKVIVDFKLKTVPIKPLEYFLAIVSENDGCIFVPVRILNNFSSPVEDCIIAKDEKENLEICNVESAGSEESLSLEKQEKETEELNVPIVEESPSQNSQS